MTKRGPPPKPEALRELDGYPDKRRKRKEPTFEPVDGEIAPPSFLTAEAKEEWRRMLPILRASGLLTEGDLVPLAAYCALYARWRFAEEMLGEKTKAKGDAYITRAGNGYEQASPWVNIASRSLELMKGYLIEFGLTPAARARMGAAEPPPPPTKGKAESEAPKIGGKFSKLIGANTRPN